MVRLAFFVTATDPDSGDAISGALALAELLKQESAYFQKAGTTDLARLDKFVAFSWLLTDNYAKILEAMKDNALSALGVSLKRSSDEHNAASSGKAAKTELAKEKRSKCVKVAADALFD